MFKMHRRRSNEKKFKTVTFLLLTLCVIMFCFALQLKSRRHENEIITSVEENQEDLKNIVIEFREPEEKLMDEFPQQENFFGDIPDIDLTDEVLGNISTKVQHNIIVASWRTGSTLTGNILKTYPRSFYHYEPFMYIQQDLHKLNATIIQDVLKHLLLCNYTGIDSLMQFNNEKMWPWSFNTQLWPFCNAFASFCKSPVFLSTICKLFPVQIIKTVRVALDQVSEMLPDPLLNLKLVLLVRDPRGVMNSRTKQNWCLHSETCMSSELLCARMKKDYYEAKRLKKIYPNQVEVIRYEDLVSWPHKTTKALYEFFGMEMTKEVINYLNLNTISQIGRTQPEIAAMLRRHGSFYSHWVAEMEFEAIQEVQDHCKEAMELYGYREMDDWTEQTGIFEALADFSI